MARHYVFCFRAPAPLPAETIMPDSKSEIKVVKTVNERERETKRKTKIEKRKAEKQKNRKTQKRNHINTNEIEYKINKNARNINTVFGLMETTTTKGFLIKMHFEYSCQPTNPS